MSKALKSGINLNRDFSLSGFILSEFHCIYIIIILVPPVWGNAEKSGTVSGGIEAKMEIPEG
jgi:hypothetical protein